jgi:hypothetical protein
VETDRFSRNINCDKMMKVVWIEFPFSRAREFDAWLKKAKMNLPRGFEIKRVE